MTTVTPTVQTLETQYAEAMYEFGRLSMQLRELESQRAELKAALQKMHENCIGLNAALTTARSATQRLDPNPQAPTTDGDWKTASEGE